MLQQSQGHLRGSLGVLRVFKGVAGAFLKVSWGIREVPGVLKGLIEGTPGGPMRISGGPRWFPMESPGRFREFQGRFRNFMGVSEDFRGSQEHFRLSQRRFRGFQARFRGLHWDSREYQERFRDLRGILQGLKGISKGFLDVS